MKNSAHVRTVLFFSLGLAGACGKAKPVTAAVTGKTYTIEWNVKDQTNPTYAPGIVGAKAAAAELTQAGPDTVKVNISGENDGGAKASVQVPLLQTAITNKVDGIIVTAASSSDAPTIAAINQAVAAGIPVLTFDTDVPSSKRLAYFAIDSYNAGKAAGQSALASTAFKTATNKTYAIVTGSVTAGNLNDRAAGFQNAFQSAGWACATSNPNCLHTAGSGPGCINGSATPSLPKDAAGNPATALPPAAPGPAAWSPCTSGGALAAPSNCFFNDSAPMSTYCGTTAYGGTVGTVNYSDQLDGDAAAVIETLMTSANPPGAILLTGAFPFRCTAASAPAGQNCAAAYVDEMPNWKAAAKASPPTVLTLVVSGTQQEEEAVQDGLVQVVAAQPLYNYGYESVKIMYDNLKGKTPQADATGFIDAGFFLVCPNNISQAYAQWTSNNFGTAISACALP